MAICSLQSLSLVSPTSAYKSQGNPVSVHCSLELAMCWLVEISQAEALWGNLCFAPL